MILDKILAEWKKDSIINEAYLDNESLRIIQLHSKYLEIIGLDKQKIKKLYAKRKQLIKHLNNYYKGEYNENERVLNILKKSPLRSKVLKGDIFFKVDHDSGVMGISLDIDEISVRIQVVDEILKSLYSRNFNIKNAVDWQKMIGGNG